MHYSLEVSTLPNFSETATCWLFNSAVISTNKTALQYFDKVFVTADLPLSEELPASQALIS